MNLWLLARLAALVACAAAHQAEGPRGSAASVPALAASPLAPAGPMSAPAPSASVDVDAAAAPAAAQPAAQPSAAPAPDAPLFGGPADVEPRQGESPRRRALRVSVQTASRRGRRVLARYFPALYEDLDVEHVVLLKAGIGEARSYTSKDGTHGIEWPAREDEPADARVDTPFGGPRLQRRVVDLVVYLHEYAHALFDETVGRAEADAGGGWTARSAITEGFAVTLELASIERMLQEPGFWGLTREDLDDLRSWRRQRLGMLRESRNHYADGTFKFIKPLFEAEGEAGLKSVLERLNGKTLEAFPYERTVFRLVARDADVWRPVFSQPVADQPALAGLRGLMVGAPVSARERAAALDLIERADRRSIDRVAAQYFVTPERGPSDFARRPGPVLVPGFRLAAESPRVAAAFAKLAGPAARSKRVLETMTLHPLWAEAFLSGLTTIPLDAAARAAWQRTIERWLASPPIGGADDARVRQLAPGWLAMLRL